MINPTEDTYHYQYIVDNDFKNNKIRDILISYGFSSRLISTVKNKGKLLLNDKPARFIDKAQKGDQIDVYLPDKIVDYIKPVKGPLDIIYEDSEVLIVNKPTLTVVHPTHDYQENTLANYIANYFKETNQNVKVRFVNRLDRDTTGIVVVAKNKFVHHYIQSRMSTDEVKKFYTAIVENIPAKKEGIIDLPIYRPDNESIERIIDERGKDSQTVYKVTKDLGDFAEIECELLTGRTHQIRVHMKAIGNPLIGDPLYNPDSKIPFNRQALHAKRIELVLPKSGKKIFEASLPDDLVELEKNLKDMNNE